MTTATDVIEQLRADNLARRGARPVIWPPRLDVSEVVATIWELAPEELQPLRAEISARALNPADHRLFREFHRLLDELVGEALDGEPCPDPELVEAISQRAPGALSMQEWTPRRPRRRRRG